MYSMSPKKCNEGQKVELRALIAYQFFCLKLSTQQATHACKSPGKDQISPNANFPKVLLETKR